MLLDRIRSYCLRCPTLPDDKEGVLAFLTVCGRTVCATLTKALDPRLRP